MSRFLVVFVAAALTVPFLVAEDGAAGSTHLSGKVIVVDPGHGGSDPGAIGYGLEEADVVLDISLRLRDLLEAEGAKVIMTRTTDTYVSLSTRVSIANTNNADRFVSVHANACGSCGGHGTETYYHSGLSSSSTAAHLAGKVQPQIVDLLGTRDRGVKTANFYVLRETSMPAILVETAFIDHPDDNALLASATKRQDFARAILFGVQAHYGITPHDPTGGSTDTTPPSIRFTAPDFGAWHRDVVTVSADVTDASGVAWVRANVDGGSWHWDSTPPHQWSWDTNAFSDGSHSVRVQAKDNAGNYGNAYATLRVDNTPPSASTESPRPGDVSVAGTTVGAGVTDEAIVVGRVTVKASASDATSGVARVRFYVDGSLRHTDSFAPYEWSWDATLQPGAHTLSVRAEDHAGNVRWSSVDVLAV